MSEELKQKAREELSKAAAQFVIDRAKMRGLTIDQFLQGNAVGLMAEFASQVCEQREKEPFPKRSEVCISLFGCCDSEETWRPGIEGWGDSDEKSRSNGYISVGDYDELFNRAEAAELALQAKERELREIAAALQCTDEFDEHSDVVTRAREVVSELAQARQQAVADLREEYKAVVETGQAMSNVFFNTAQLKEYPADYREKANALRVKWDEARRSLTPPPALTKDEPCQEKGVWLNGGKAYCDEHRQGGIPFEFGKKCGESVAMKSPALTKEK